MRSTTALAVRSSVTSSPAAPPRSTATIGATFLSPEATAIRLGTLASSSSVSATRQSFDGVLAGPAVAVDQMGEQLALRAGALDRRAVCRLGQVR